MKKTSAAIMLLVLAACAPPPPANPKERHARIAAAGEFVATRCAAYAGGYDAVRSIRSDATKHRATAKNLGATEADFQAAAAVTANTFATASAFTNHQTACNELIGHLAWSS